MFDYAAYIPSGTRGAVLMTSRIPQCNRYSTVESEALEGLDLEHSTQLLLKAAKLPPESWPSCKRLGEDVVHLLGSHTLALIQAGAYIAEGFCRLDQYPQRYQQQRKRLLEHYPEQEQSRYRDVYATFEASADVLQHLKSDASTDALELLAILSMFHSSVLPLQVFGDAWEGARQVLQATISEKDKIGALDRQHVPWLPELIGMQADKWDDYRLKKASALLASLSLVTRHHTGDLDGLSMHPLAHAWAKDRLEYEQQQQAWVSAGCLLALSREQSQMWQVPDKELRPHVQFYLSPIFDADCSYEPRKLILPIILRCGWILHFMREDAKLELLLDSLFRELGIMPSDPSEEYLLIWDLAAGNLINMGNASQAVNLLEHVINVRKTTLVKTHPDLLTSQNTLASAYMNSGQTKEAVTLLEHVVRVRETTLVETHPSRLTSQHELARAYMNSGQTKEAVALLEHVVKVEETTLVETHPSRLTSQHELARAYMNSGQTKEAVALLEHVVRVHETTLVETHPSRLTSQHALARAYMNSGQTKEAVTLLEHVVKVEETTLVETHPSRLSSQHALACAYMDSGQTKEAVTLQEHVVRVHETTLVETHPDRRSSERMLSHILLKAKQSSAISP
jgi:tetratricopeptide (TPR) repeat protein